MVETELIHARKGEALLELRVHLIRRWEHRGISTMFPWIIKLECGRGSVAASSGGLREYIYTSRLWGTHACERQRAQAVQTCGGSMSNKSLTRCSPIGLIGLSSIVYRRSSYLLYAMCIGGFREALKKGTPKY